MSLDRYSTVTMIKLFTILINVWSDNILPKPSVFIFNLKTLFNMTSEFVIPSFTTSSINTIPQMVHCFLRRHAFSGRPIDPLALEGQDPIGPRPTARCRGRKAHNLSTVTRVTAVETLVERERKSRQLPRS